MPSLYADGAANLAHSFSFLDTDLPTAPAFGNELLFRLDAFCVTETIELSASDSSSSDMQDLMGSRVEEAKRDIVGEAYRWMTYFSLDWDFCLQESDGQANGFMARGQDNIHLAL